MEPALRPAVYCRCQVAIAVAAFLGVIIFTLGFLTGIGMETPVVRRFSAIDRSSAVTCRAALPMLLLAACCFGSAEVHADAPQLGYRVVASYPHDPTAFTQGLLVQGDRLFESTGGYGESSVRVTDLASGRILRQRSLASNLFSEGLALTAGQLYQLTWKAGVGLVHDSTTLEQVGQFSYPGEGWGLTTNNEHLIMSDGSAHLRFLDRTDLRELRRVEVRDGDRPVAGLNELEYIEGSLYANIWPTDRIAIINPSSGQVQGWLDLSDILPLVFRHPRIDVLNGIAYDAEAKRLFITGKRWPRLFEIEVLPAEKP